MTSCQYGLPVRVVVVSAWEPWRRRDGATLVLREQLRRLAARHDIVVLAAAARRREAQVPDAAAREFRDVALRWFGTPTPRGIDAAGRRAWALASGEPAHVRYVERPALVSALDHEVPGADVVHLHGWGTARLWRCAAGRPTVHVAIDPWRVNAVNRRVGAVHRLADAGEQRRVERHERRHYPRVGAVVVVAPHDADALRVVVPDARIEVVPNGVSAGPAPVALPDRPVVGFHGSFETRANVEAARQLVVDLLPLIRAAIPDVRVRLVGDRPPDAIRSLVGGPVLLSGSVPQVRPALDDMTVHVDWFTSGTGMKNKVLEAMAAGRPVVASALGAAGIGAGPGVTVAPDVPAAAAAVIRLLRDRPAATRQGAAGRQRVEAEFGWDRSADRLDALWRDVASR